MHYKLGIYGDAGVGKSVFALGWEKPYFICTDENYEFLKPFGAKEQDHIQLTSWQEFKKLVDKNNFDGYETIVIDLIEDLYQWAEYEYCKKNGLDFIGDLGYGKGYRIVQNDFTYYLLKIINLNKNVILLSHEENLDRKSNRGIGYTDYNPSSYIPKKCWQMIDGKLRFFFRAYIEEVEDGDRIVRKRLLSVSPKPHEFQVNRGVNVDNLPNSIDLTYEAFCNTFGTPSNQGDIQYKASEIMQPNIAVNKPLQQDNQVAKQVYIKPSVEKVETKKVEETKVVEQVKTDEKPKEEPKQADREEKAKETNKISSTTKTKTSTDFMNDILQGDKLEQVKVEEKKVNQSLNTSSDKKDTSQKIADIKKKLAELQAKKGN